MLKRKEKEAGLTGSDGSSGNEDLDKSAPPQVLPIRVVLLQGKLRVGRKDAEVSLLDLGVDLGSGARDSRFPRIGTRQRWPRRR